MRIFIADAFTDTPFGGNPAGVVLLDAAFPPEEEMQKIAAELRHSETVFVLPLGGASFHLRYFTPRAEVEVCGHATIAAFALLQRIAGLAPGHYIARTASGELAIDADESIWMQMPPSLELQAFSPEEALPLYKAMGLASCHSPLPPAIVRTGLADILLPVSCALDALCPDMQALRGLSEQFGVCGFHVFAPAEGFAAACRNFAPLVGIDEESATGTANAGLAFYLEKHGLVRAGERLRFLQGEALGRPSIVEAILREGRCQIGGRAAIAFECLPLYQSALP